MEIKPYEKNAKKHPKEQLYKIACSIRDFGWRQPMVVDSDGVIIVGHGRWYAYERYAKEMNLPEPRVDVAKDLTPEQVHTYRLADNLVVSQEYDMDIVNAELAAVPLGFEPYQAMLAFDTVGEQEKKDEEKGHLNDEGLANYIKNSIRQVVCLYAQTEYTELMEKCEVLLKHYGLETNSELFAKLVNEAHENHTAKA